MLIQNSCPSGINAGVLIGRCGGEGGREGGEGKGREGCIGLSRIVCTCVCVEEGNEDAIQVNSRV